MDRARNQLGESIDIINACRRPYEAYFCPACGNRLILRSGNERRCFAHQVGVAPDCRLRVDEGFGGGGAPKLGGDLREVGKALVRAFCNYFDCSRLPENDVFLGSDEVTRAQLVVVHFGNVGWGQSQFPLEQRDAANVLSRLVSADLAGALRQILAAIIRMVGTTDVQKLPKLLSDAACNIRWEIYFSGMGDGTLLPSPWIECDEPMTLVYHKKQGRFGKRTGEIYHDVRYGSSVVLEFARNRPKRLRIARLRRDINGNQRFEIFTVNNRMAISYEEAQTLIVFMDPLTGPARLYVVAASRPSEVAQPSLSPPLMHSQYTTCGFCGCTLKVTNLDKHAQRCKSAPIATPDDAATKNVIQTAKQRKRILREARREEAKQREAAEAEESKRKEMAKVATRNDHAVKRKAEEAERKDRQAAEAEAAKRKEMARQATAAAEAMARAIATVYATSLVMRPEMVRIPGGTFSMGSALDDELASLDEKPRHEVTVSPYWIGKEPVTQKLYAEVMAERSGYKVDDNVPVSLVSWLGAVRFCNILSTRHGLAPVYREEAGAWVIQPEANGYRLPTEAEWEYAARGNDGRTYPWGSKVPSSDVCWGVVGSAQQWDGPYPVGGHPAGASAFGLLDMVGNVMELVWDGYAPYCEVPVTNPQGPDPHLCGPDRVLRGIDLRVASRTRRAKSARSNKISFRVARGNFPPLPAMRRAPPVVPRPYGNPGTALRTRSLEPPRPLGQFNVSERLRPMAIPASIGDGNRRADVPHEGRFTHCPYCPPGAIVRRDFLEAHLKQAHRLLVDDHGRIVRKRR